MTARVFANQQVQASRVGQVCLVAGMTAVRNEQLRTYTDNPTP